MKRSFPLARSLFTICVLHFSFAGVELGAADPLPAPSTHSVRFSAAANLYGSVSGAVVGISCRKGRFDYFGSGAVIDPSGLVLTSVTVVPRGARDVKVFLRGGRIAEADPVLASPDKEASLIRIRDADHIRVYPLDGLAYLRLGKSRELKLGDPVLTLGNSFRSIEQDDRVSVAAGVISGRFELTERREPSRYVGPTIETTAALNNGVDGGPLVNERGEVVGLLSLNFSRQRWLGTAIPIDTLKPLIALHHDWFDDSRLDERDEEVSRCYLGIELEEVSGREVRVLRLWKHGPASEAGVQVGDRVHAYDGEVLESLDDFRRIHLRVTPGATLRWTVERDGALQEIVLDSWARF